MLVILTRIADFLLVDILYSEQNDSLIEEMPYDKREVFRACLKH